MTFTFLEIMISFLVAYLGIISARSNIYLVLDWTKNPEGRIKGLKFLSVVDAIIIVGMSVVGYFGLILVTFFISKALYLMKIDYESTLSQ